MRKRKKTRSEILEAETRHHIAQWRSIPFALFGCVVGAVLGALLFGLICMDADIMVNDGIEEENMFGEKVTKMDWDSAGLIVVASVIGVITVVVVASISYGESYEDQYRRLKK